MLAFDTSHLVTQNQKKCSYLNFPETLKRIDMMVTELSPLLSDVSTITLFPERYTDSWGAAGCRVLRRRGCLGEINLSQGDRFILSLLPLRWSLDDCDWPSIWSRSAWLLCANTEWSAKFWREWKPLTGWHKRELPNSRPGRGPMLVRFPGLTRFGEGIRDFYLIAKFSGATNCIDKLTNCSPASEVLKGLTLRSPGSVNNPQVSGSYFYVEGSLH